MTLYHNRASNPFRLIPSDARRSWANRWPWIRGQCTFSSARTLLFPSHPRTMIYKDYMSCVSARIYTFSLWKNAFVVIFIEYDGQRVNVSFFKEVYVEQNWMVELIEFEGQWSEEKLAVRFELMIGYFLIFYVWLMIFYLIFGTRIICDLLWKDNL